MSKILSVCSHLEQERFNYTCGFESEFFCQLLRPLKDSFLLQLKWPHTRISKRTWKNQVLKHYIHMFDPHGLLPFLWYRQKVLGHSSFTVFVLDLRHPMCLVLVVKCFFELWPSRVGWTWSLLKRGQTITWKGLSSTTGLQFARKVLAQNPSTNWYGNIYTLCKV